MTTTDTPNACPHCGAAFATLEGGTTFTCGSNRHPDSSISQSYLCLEREARQKAEAEVERLRGQLQQAVDIAEVFESELDEYHSVDRNCPDAAWHYPYGWERSEEAKNKLEALNKEIK